MNWGPTQRELQLHLDDMEVTAEQLNQMLRRIDHQGERRVEDKINQIEGVMMSLREMLADLADMVYKEDA